MGLIEKVDQFGIPMSIKVIGKEKHTSFLGAIATMFAFSAAFVLFYFMGTDLWYRRNPTVVPNEVRHEEMQQIVLSEEKYPILLNIRFFKDNVHTFNLKDTPYNIQVDYQHYDDRKPGTDKTMCDVWHDLTTPCNEHSIKKLPHYKDKDLQNYICVDFKKIRDRCRAQNKIPDYEPVLEGELTDIVRAYIRIAVHNVEYNEAKKVIRFGKQADLSKWTNVDFHIQYPSIALDNQRPVDPLKTISQEEQHILKIDTFKSEWKWFKKITFLDDQGWFYEAIDKTQSIELERQTSDFYNLTYTETKRIMFYRVILMMSHSEQEHFRRYIKIQDVIATSASFVKGIAAICWLFVLWKGQKQLDQKLAEELFYVDKKNLNVVVEVLQDSYVSTAQVAKPKQEVPKKSFFSCCFNLCKEKTVSKLSNEAVSNATNYIHSKLDVLSIVRLFKQFEQMKEMVLTEAQLQELTGESNVHQLEKN